MDLHKNMADFRKTDVIGPLIATHCLERKYRKNNNKWHWAPPYFKNPNFGGPIKGYGQLVDMRFQTRPKVWYLDGGCWPLFPKCVVKIKLTYDPLPPPPGPLRLASAYFWSSTQTLHLYQATLQRTTALYWAGGGRTRCSCPEHVLPNSPERTIMYVRTVP